MKSQNCSILKLVLSSFYNVKRDNKLKNVLFCVFGAPNFDSFYDVWLQCAVMVLSDGSVGVSNIVAIKVY